MLRYRQGLKHVGNLMQFCCDKNCIKNHLCKQTFKKRSISIYIPHCLFGAQLDRISLVYKADRIIPEFGHYCPQINKLYIIYQHLITCDMASSKAYQICQTNNHTYSCIKTALRCKILHYVVRHYTTL